MIQLLLYIYMVGIDTNNMTINPPWYQEYVAEIDMNGMINTTIKSPWYQEYMVKIDMTIKPSRYQEYMVKINMNGTIYKTIKQVFNLAK